MGLKYNAFISYRHSEADSKIASEVQMRLERFRIPQAIVKKTGVKRIERIFRDKEELPITSDLNEDIDMALANSDKLIVICSTRTGESIWVRKEIETFLKYHDKKDVFTVLVDGEPEEVIPDILMHDTVTTVLPGGGIETKEELIEPLSCDYRMDIKRARRVELPRLAAAIIGCSYDELVQRRRQYIRRRNTIIGFAAAISALAIIGYLTWSLLQIRMNYDRAEANYALAQSNLALAEENYAQAQENYMDSLRNQSAYLASESTELLFSGDRLGAVQLALAALPSEGKERPITPEAEYALASALGVYMTPGLSDSLAVWKYGSGYKIQKFLVDEDNMRVASLDAIGTLSIWSFRDHALLAAFTSDTSKIKDFIIDNAGRVAITYNDHICVIDSNLEDELWNFEYDEDLSTLSGAASLILSNDGSELLYYVRDISVIFDIKTGNVNARYSLNQSIEGADVFGYNIIKAVFSSDDRLVAMEYMTADNNRKITVLNRETGEFARTGDEYAYIGDITFVPDAEKLIFTSEENVSASSYYVSGLQVIRETNLIVECYDISSGKSLWKNSVPHSLVDFDSGIMFVEYEGEDAVAIFLSNKCMIVGLESGDVLTLRELTSEYIDAYPSAGNKLSLILRNGMYMILKLEDPNSSMNGYSYFSDNIDDSLMVVDSNNVRHFLIKYEGNNYLTEYSTFFYDKTYTPVEGTSETSDIYSSYVADKNLLALDYDMNLYCVDMSNGKLVWTTKVEGTFCSAVEFAGRDEYGNVFINNNNNISGSSSGKIYKINISDGDITKVSNFPERFTLYTDYSGGYIYSCFPGGYGEDPYIVKFNPSTEEAEEIYLKYDGEDSFSTCEIYVSADGKHAILSDRLFDKVAYLADLETGALLTLDITGETFASWSPDSEWLVISNGENVAIYECDGPRVALLNDFETEIADVYACERGVVVLMDNGLACLYDKAGNLISSIDAFRGNLTSISTAYKDVSFFESDNMLIIDYGEYSSLIIMDEFKIKAIVTGFLGYHEESGRIFAKMYANVGGAGAFGSFKVRTIEELIAEGIQFVGDETLPSDMKKRYGIED